MEIKIYALSKDCVIHAIENEIIIVPIAGSDLLSLNSSASIVIQQLMKGKSTINTLAEKLSSVYDVSFKIACEDIQFLLDDLIEKRIVELVEN